MDDIREQIDRLRDTRYYEANGLEAQAADTMEKLLTRNELLEIVLVIAEQMPRFEDTMPSLEDPKLLALDQALDRALDAVQTTVQPGDLLK